MESFETALDAAMDATRIRSNEVPTVLDEDRALVELELPDQERFADGNWMLMIVSVDLEAFEQRLNQIIHREGEYAGVVDELAEALGLDPAALPTAEELQANPDEAWKLLFQSLSELMEDTYVKTPSSENEEMITEADTSPDGTAEGEAFLNEVAEDETCLNVATEAGISSDATKEDGISEGEELSLLFAAMDVLKGYFKDVIYAGSAAAGQDGRTVRLVSTPGATIPVLYRMEFDSEVNLQSVGLAVYVFGTWLDVGTLIAGMLGPESDEENAEKAIETEETEESEEEFDLSWLAELFGLESEETEVTKETEETEVVEEAEETEEEFDLSWLADLFSLESEETEETEAVEKTEVAEESDEEFDLSWLADLFGLESEETEVTKETEETEAVEKAEESEEEFDLSWLTDLFGWDSEENTDTTDGESDESEEDGFLKGLLLGGLKGTGDLLLGLIRELVIYDIQPGAIKRIPSDGLDQVIVLTQEEYPILQDLFNPIDLESENAPEA